MSALQEYNKTIWEDLPSEETPINAENLNKIENQIEAITDDVMANNLLSKLIYKGEVALLTDLPSADQKVGDYYIVVVKGVPYVWNGTEFKAQVIIPEGGETAHSLGTLISSAVSKTIPDVDDVIGLSDSEDVVNPNILKKLTWGNLRGSLATFFEGIFALVLHGHAISDVTDLQNSLDAKALKANPTFTGTVVLPSTTSIGNITNTELSYVYGVTSAIQTQLNAKAPLVAPALTGAATLDGRRIISNNSSAGTAVHQVWSGTQAQYDAIGSKNANTVYFIV